MGVETNKPSVPVRLADGHRIEGFSCGDAGVDTWLRDRAIASQKSGSARTFVVCVGEQVVAYYCLSNAIIEREELATAKLRKGQPPAVPAILIGQLGVDYRYQGHGLGRALLKDALGRALHISKHSGVVVIHLHASTDSARDYYLHLNLGFQLSRTTPRTLYLPLATIEQALLPELLTDE
ncbi:MAG TPA: GNAT family N-acetyltransferase [Thermomicrobiales bacterium]|nr:GNAT family N-acetyltransferase [Thermomicrobiales bacterium]